MLLQQSLGAQQPAVQLNAFNHALCSVKGILAGTVRGKQEL